MRWHLMLEDDQWKPVRLCDISSIKHGWAFKGEYMFEELTGKPILVNIGNFSYTGGFRFESTRTREYRGEYPKEYELKPGDILLAMTCQTSGGEILGIPARVPDDGRVYLHNQRLGKVVVNNPEKVFPGFLYWLFLWKNFNAHLCATATGTKILHTAPNRIEEYAFLLPPINGQKNIARTLYAIDNKIQLNLSINALLETVGEAVFKRWFVEFEFPNEEGKPYKSSGGEMVYNQELGKEIPLGWQLTTLEKVAEFTRGFSYNGLEKSTIEGDLVFMTLNSIYEGGGFKREFAYLTSNRLKDRHLLNEGDLIIPNTEQTKTGTLLGFPALVEFPNNYGKRVGCFSHHLTKVTPFNKETKLYLFYYLHFNQVNAIKYHTGSVIWGLDVKGFIENEMILIPNSEVLNAFSEFATQIFGKKLLNNKQSTTLSAMRDSLLPKLMSGKIRVPIEKQEAS